MTSSGNRGVTLVEITVVIVIASLVMGGIMAFYLNSQAVWLDASSQAITQRDATLLLERMSQETRKASRVQAAFDPADSLHQSLLLFDASNVELCRFHWHAEDSLVHWETGISQTDRGPIVTSQVDRFQLDANDSLVFLRRLTLYSSHDERVELTSAFAIYNR